MIKKNVIILLLLNWCLFTAVAVAANHVATDIYQFSSKKQEHQFQQLSKELRCLVCQNQTLAESNAPLAKDLRFQVYKMVKKGKSKQEIIDYLVERYGDFILFKPPMSKLTYVLWFAPFIILLAALVRLVMAMRRRRRQQLAEPKHFSAEDRRRIKHLLSQY